MTVLPTRNEKLEIEEEDARQKRLQSLLERMSTTENTTKLPPPTSMPRFDFENCTTTDFTPNTELLSRIQAFLPEIEASNRELLDRAKSNPTSVDIEHLEDREGGYIEMNLGLGVYEQRRKRKERRKARRVAKKRSANAPKGDDATDDAMDSDSSSSPSSSSSSSGSSSSDSSLSISSGSSSSSSSSSDDSDSDMDSDDSDASTPDPLTAFLQSLPHTTLRGAGDSTDDDSEDEDDSDSESDSSSGDEAMIPLSERLIKPLPKTRRGPTIEVLAEARVANGDGEHAESEKRKED